MKHRGGIGKIAPQGDLLESLRGILHRVPPQVSGGPLEAVRGPLEQIGVPVPQRRPAILDQFGAVGQEQRNDF